MRRRALRNVWAVRGARAVIVRSGASARALDGFEKLSRGMEIAALCENKSEWVVQDGAFALARGRWAMMGDH